MNLVGYDDKIFWCLFFVNWCMVYVGFCGIGFVFVCLWFEWGKLLECLVYGCIVILMWDDLMSWKGYVGFYLWYDVEYVYLFGGN